MTRTRNQRRRRQSTLISNAIQLAIAAGSANAAQPTYPGTPGQFKQVGDAGVSAQQIFLGTPNTVCVVVIGGVLVACGWRD